MKLSFVAGSPYESAKKEGEKSEKIKSTSKSNIEADDSDDKNNIWDTSNSDSLTDAHYLARKNQPYGSSIK